MAPSVIALDLDDTLCLTNPSVVQWHNDVYGTDMTLDDFKYYHYWKNRSWGTPRETFDKVGVYYGSSHFLNRMPVPGMVEYVEKLKKEGYRLVVVTARGPDLQAETQQWLQRYLPGMFDSIHYTGEFTKWRRDDRGHMTRGSSTKAEILSELGAKLLVDDCIDHALDCAMAEPSIPVLLFGDYTWGKRTSKALTAEDLMSYEDRVKAGVHEQWLERDLIKELPNGIKRVKDWSEAAQLIRQLVPVDP